jgi:hypothetical protein
LKATTEELHHQDGTILLLLKEAKKAGFMQKRNGDAFF